MALYRSPEYQTSDPWAGPYFYLRAVIQYIIMYEQVNLILPMKFRVKFPFCSGEVVGNFMYIRL